jgi:hypothetical protein
VPLAVMQRIEEESKNVIMAGTKYLAKLTTKSPLVSVYSLWGYQHIK